MSDKIGIEMFLYLNTGDDVTPVWSLINAVNVRRNLSKGAADLSKRNQGGWKQERATLKTGRFTFGMIYNQADTNYTYLETHFFADSAEPFEIAIADGPIATSGTKYVRTFVDVFNFPTEEPLEGGVTSEIEVGVAPGPLAPSLNTVA